MLCVIASDVMVRFSPALIFVVPLMTISDVEFVTATATFNGNNVPI